jgi:hypothetical protein
MKESCGSLLLITAEIVVGYIRLGDSGLRSRELGRSSSQLRNFTDRAQLLSPFN